MVSERLASYIKHKSISYYAFENAIGAGRGSISKAVKDNKNIGSGLLENILIVYKDLNPSWLLTGIGEMICEDGDLNDDLNDDLNGHNQSEKGLSDIRLMENIKHAFSHLNDDLSKDLNYGDVMIRLSKLEKLVDQFNTSHEKQKDKVIELYTKLMEARDYIKKESKRWF